MPGPRTRSAATRAAYYNRTQGQTSAPVMDTEEPLDGETRWEDTGFGFAERQIYDADSGRWIGTGETANIDRPSGGGAGRTQFPSERAADEARAALDIAQAQNMQTPEERALDRTAEERINRLRDLNNLIQQAMSNQQSAREMKFGLRAD